MTVPQRRARRGPVALLVLVLVLAVCAMHQLGGGHEGMTMQRGTSPVMALSPAHAAVVDHPVRDAATKDAAMNGPAESGDPAPGGTVLAGPGPALSALAPGSSDVPAVLTPVCLAVLLLGASALLALRTSSRLTTPARPTATTVVRRAVSRAPPRDLLAQLCILRT